MFNLKKKSVNFIHVMISIIACVFTLTAYTSYNSNSNKSFGSQKILYHLWSEQDLCFNASELKISDYYVPKKTKFDLSKYIVSSDLEEKWSGVLRSVKFKKDEDKFVALTFDFCELETKTFGYDGRIIDFLRDNNVSATLFLGGKWMLSHQERAMQLIVDPLFEIGNHSWSHANFAILPDDKAKDQILYTQYYYNYLYDRVINLLGESFKDEVDKIPRSQKLFRFPYGRLNDSSLELVRELGLKPIQWNILGIETKDPTLRDCEEFVKKLTNGSIILLHANAIPKYTFNFVKMMVNMLNNLGYKFVTVSELLAKGEPEIFKDGYFMSPGDNHSLDLAYGEYGTMHHLRK